MPHAAPALRSASAVPELALLLTPHFSVNAKEFSLPSGVVMMTMPAGADEKVWYVPSQKYAKPGSDGAVEVQTVVRCACAEATRATAKKSWWISVVGGYGLTRAMDAVRF